jgi:predicted metalloprotease with PDZ domain
MPKILCTLFRICFAALALNLVFEFRINGEEIKAESESMKVEVDATEVTRKLLHSNLTIPVTPGQLTLYYPKWIPGEHAPKGPILGLIDLRLSAGGKGIAWRRDLVDLYAIHCDIPDGVRSLNVTLSYAMPIGTDGFSSAASASGLLGIVNWNQVILYPAGLPTDQIKVEAAIRLPNGWKFGTALPIADSAGPVKFKPVTLTTLVDSPVVTGIYYRNVPLANDAPTNQIDIVADSPGALALPDADVSHYRQLVEEAKSLFGATHYEHYHFLVTLSNNTFHSGIEHHESSLNTQEEQAFTDKDLLADQDLLPHEFVHSWNGKYRRPASLTTSDYQKPMEDDLLWVYEGLTEYLGSLVLTSRSGLRDAELTHEWLASQAATLDHRSGRTWRSLQDTADAASLLYDAPKEWRDRSREVDFYPEGVLLWLEADARIRKESQGTRSLDDFCHAFFGPPNGAPEVRTYTVDDVVNGLNNVASSDWRQFWTDRLNSLSKNAPLGGIDASGWHLVYTDQPNKIELERDKIDKNLSLNYSLGFVVHEDGTIVDVLAGSPADIAKIGPGMKLVAVNSRGFTPEGLKQAVSASNAVGAGPIELLINNADYFRVYSVDYKGGARYPHLERDGSKPDMLGEILKPKTTG